MLYRLLKTIVNIGLFFYYRKIKVENRKALDYDGPCLILANHPNTLVDAWLVGSIMPRQPFFMAKATFFKGKLRSKLLRSLGMIPINRKSDASTDGVSNTDSFLACYQILEERNPLAMFPEGTSFQERRLRELKSGAARIALETMHRNGKDFPLKIITIGINYLDAEKFRSDIVVNIGNPISVADFFDPNEVVDTRSARKLTEKIRISLEQLLVNSDSKEDELLVEDFYAALNSKYISSEKDGALGNVEQLKDIRDTLMEWKITSPYKVKEAQNLLAEIKQESEANGIDTQFLDRKIRTSMFFRQLLTSSIFLILALPLFIYGCVHNLFQYLFTDFTVKRLTKEIEYYAPLAVLLGLILYPLIYILFLHFISDYFQLSFWVKSLYAISMPVTGFFAYFFYNYKSHVSTKWKYFSVLKNKRMNVEQLQLKKERLRSLFED